MQTGNIGTTEDGPYRQSYTLDTWGNMTTKWGRSFTGTNRRTQTVYRYYDSATGRMYGWAYDNDGHVVAGDSLTNTYDAAGRLRASDGGGVFDYDGDGIKSKSLTEAGYVFQLRSSVLGQTLAEIDITDGTRRNGFVYADSELIATQSMGLIYWQHKDPSQRSTRTTDANQDSVGHDELDPNGSKVDGPGGHHYNGGTGGGHVLGSGGIAARVASLMDIRTCSYATMAVPCSMVANFRQHIQSTGQAGVDHWNGITTWDVAVTANFGKVTASWTFRNLRAGLFAYKSGPYTKNNELGLKDFSNMNNALRIAAGLDIVPLRASGPPTLVDAQKTGQKGRLTGDRLRQYVAAKDTVLYNLANSDSCKKFLLDHLGLSIGAVASAVSSQRPFDGLTSTISAADAGLTPRIDPSTNQPHPLANKQVRDLFTGTSNYYPTAIQAGFASAEDRGATQRDVYYGYDFDASTVLHETLHSFTGLDDKQLMEKLGGNISVELENAGCA